MIIDLCYVIFFFFKQKTAYEMRISDWSSDVCSSDLDLLDGKRAEIQRIEGRAQFVLDDEKARTAVGKDVLELHAARGDVDRHCNRTEPGAAEDRKRLV